MFFRTPVRMNDLLERNKQTAQAFYDLTFNQCRPREAIEKYAGASYTRHNPTSPPCDRIGSGRTA